MTRQPGRARCPLPRRLWDDDSGAIIASEWLLFGTLLVLGLIPAFVAVRQGALDGLLDFANATQALDQSYSFSGQRLEYHCWDRDWYPGHVHDWGRTGVRPGGEAVMPRVDDPAVAAPHDRWGRWVGTAPRDPGGWELRGPYAWDHWGCGAETAGSQFIKLPPAQLRLRQVPPNFQGTGSAPCN
jgi:hypothetical protein